MSRRLSQRQCSDSDCKGSSRGGWLLPECACSCVACGCGWRIWRSCSCSHPSGAAHSNCLSLTAVGSLSCTSRWVVVKEDKLGDGNDHQAPPWTLSQSRHLSFQALAIPYQRCGPTCLQPAAWLPGSVGSLWTTLTLTGVRRRGARTRERLRPLLSGTSCLLDHLASSSVNLNPA